MRRFFPGDSWINPAGWLAVFLGPSKKWPGAVRVLYLDCSHSEPPVIQEDYLVHILPGMKDARYERLYQTP